MGTQNPLAPKNAHDVKDAPIADAVTDIWEILQGLPGPRDGARALAAAHIMLINSTGATTEDQVKSMLDELSKATLEVWRETRL